jgi:hypothetical protein
VAGAGSIALHDWALAYSSTSGGDEFMRVGERLTVSLSVDEAIELLYAGDPGDDAVVQVLRGDPSKLKLALQIRYTKFDETKSDVTLPMTFASGAGGVLVAMSPELTVPEQVKSMHVDFLATYPRAGTGPAVAKLLLAPHDTQSDFVIFGAFGPDKVALFDTTGTAKRTRIVEGGGVVPGATLLVSVTDWRLDTVVDKTTLDLRYGREENYTRFGTTIVDAIGSLQYVVSAAISTDGGATYQPLDLDRVDQPDVLAGPSAWGRYAFQKLLTVPANAGPNVKIAFHIQAFLQVPQYYQGEIIDPKYAPGQLVFLKDVWDNNGGANYELAVSKSNGNSSP